MELFNSPEFAGLVAFVFIVLVAWANRCSKCGKLFTCKIRSRTQTSEGYTHSWEVDEKSQRGKSVRRYTYQYNETWACSKCGHEYSTSCSSSYSLPCGYFSPEDPANAQNKGRGCLNPLTWLNWLNPVAWWRSIPGKRYLPLLPVIFFIGMVVFDTEVLKYPTHWQDYLEDYVEFLLEPLSPRANRRTQLEMVEGRWQTQRRIQEFKPVEYETWEDRLPENARVIEKTTRQRPPQSYYYTYTTATEPATWVRYSIDLWVTIGTLTASGTGLPIAYPDDPVAPSPSPGEAVYGARRSETPTVTYSLVFRDAESERVYWVETIGFIRKEDRYFAWQREISETAYRTLIASSQPLPARVYARSYNESPNIYIYVDDVPY
ncbi:MAG: hypothetical protein CVV41_14315 [Candidatus Riflebacteria bacterium HGW-Riflebacteria-1]|jgi:transcription elongation factor Elf1|nr:MAG: hypothetical protein CVV41_14315 [Candidatus Riflebacteria bacterium HGW-Riflebacteria-1]